MTTLCCTAAANQAGRGQSTVRDQEDDDLDMERSGSDTEQAAGDNQPAGELVNKKALTIVRRVRDKLTGM